MVTGIKLLPSGADLKADYKDVINLIAITQQKIVEQADTEEPPPPSLPTTPGPRDAIQPTVQPEMFGGFGPVDQTRKVWPIAAGAGILVVLVIGIVVYNSSGNNPSLSDASLPTASPTASQSPGPQPDIRQVDFYKIPYSVFGDKYRTAKSENIPGTPVFGDLTGDGVDEAAIKVNQQYTQGSYYEDVSQGFVYTMKDGKPVLLDTFECPPNGARLEGKLVVGADIFMSYDIAIQGRNLIVPCWAPGESEATFEFYEVSTFQFNGSRLVQVGKTVKKPRYDP